MNPERPAVWSRYWATGASHSCGGSYGESYADGAFGRFWRDAFLRLRPSARVLDLACGNAPLARMLTDQRPEPGIECDAVDLADIAPAWAAGQPRVRVHPGVAAESLPFADGRFDLVMSQYGLEYSDLPRSVAELQRVRAPRSDVRLVLHHAGSRPVALAREEIVQIDWATGDQGVLAATDAILDLVQRARTAEGRRMLAVDPAADLARQRFNAAQQDLSRRLEGTLCPDPLLELRELVARAIDDVQRDGDLGRARRRLGDARAAMSDARLRLDELCRHALDEASAQALVQALRRAGETARLEPVTDREHLMAWSVSIDRI